MEIVLVIDGDDFIKESGAIGCKCPILEYKDATTVYGEYEEQLRILCPDGNDWWILEGDVEAIG